MTSKPGHRCAHGTPGAPKAHRPHALLATVVCRWQGRPRRTRSTNDMAAETVVCVVRLHYTTVCQRHARLICSWPGLAVRWGVQVAGKALKDSEHIAQQADDLIDSFSPTASFQ